MADDKYDTFVNDLVKPSGPTAPTPPPRVATGTPDLATTARDQALQRYLEVQGMNPIQKFFYGNRQENQAKRDLGVLHPIVEDQRKDALARMTLGKDLRGQEIEAMKAHTSMATFIRDLSKEFFSQSQAEQEASRPIYMGLVQKANERFGYKFDPKDIERSFTTKDFAPMAHDLFFKEPLAQDSDKQRWQIAMRYAKTDTDAMNILKAGQKEMDDRAKVFIEHGLPKIAAALGASQANQKPVSEAIAMAQKTFPDLAQSPALQRAVQQIPAEVWSQNGFIPGKATLAGQTKKAEIEAGGGTNYTRADITDQIRLEDEQRVKNGQKPFTELEVRQRYNDLARQIQVAPGGAVVGAGTGLTPPGGTATPPPVLAQREVIPSATETTQAADAQTWIKQAREVSKKLDTYLNELTPSQRASFAARVKVQGMPIIGSLPNITDKREQEIVSAIGNLQLAWERASGGLRMAASPQMQDRIRSIFGNPTNSATPQHLNTIADMMEQEIKQRAATEKQGGRPAIAVPPSGAPAPAAPPSAPAPISTLKGELKRGKPKP